ncbi:MAG: DUF1501 domain-containing protein [Bacteroidetes bacterium]|nr:MAG: DUF1501 domain-containing protein [Bacteroidota bacterium]
MQRRKFLRTAVGTALSMPLVVNGATLQAMRRSALFNTVNPDNDRVLVLVQLNGGNDGLNTIVPVDQYDNLAQVRRNILIPENDLINLNDTLALHPNFSVLRDLMDEGKAGVVQGVSYPNQNRSHFRSTDIWTSGSPADEVWTTGWLGSYLDNYIDDFPEGYPNAEYPHPFAISMGNSVTETCQGTVANYSMALSDPFSLAALTQSGDTPLPDTPYGWELGFLRNAIAQSNAYGSVITAAAEGGQSLATYPEDNRLAEQLRNVALLISGGLKTNIYVVNLGGFDTHADQVVDGETGTGEHAVLLGLLSDALTAFHEDLRLLGIENRVLSMTFSEFGRRIRSNDSLGTDHGTAAPLMLFGACVKPQVLGDNPEIDPQVGVNEGVPMQYDFRDIYGTVLMDWFEVEEDIVRALLYEGFTHLPLFNTCELVDTDDLSGNELVLAASPNPCRNQLTINFYCPGQALRLSMFDAVGSEVKVIAARRLPKGQHRIGVDMHELPAGVYFVRLQIGQKVSTKRVVKL